MNLRSSLRQRFSTNDHFPAPAGLMESLVDAKTLVLVAKKEKARINVTRKLLDEIPNITRNKIYSHWDSLDLNSKKDFLRIKIDDFMSHFETPEFADCKLEIFIHNLVERAFVGKPWLTWVCFACEHFPEFDDSQSHMMHVTFEHVGIHLSPELMSLQPIFDKDQWAKMFEMIGRCSWKPLDIPAAIEMLEIRAKSRGDGVKEAIKDWPLLDDPKRANIIKRIEDGFYLLIHHHCLSPTHLNHIMNVAKDEIFGLAGSQILIHALDQSLDCICFLRATGLKKIFRFMLEVIHGCGLTLTLNRNTDPTNGLPPSIQFPADIKEVIRLSEDSSCFLLDGCLVTTTGSTTEGAIVDDVVSKIDSLLPWIFSTPCFDELLRWDYEIDIKKNRAPLVVQNLKILVARLKKSLEEKYRLTKYDIALKVVEDLCREVENENFMESILRERKKELKNIEEHVRVTFEWDAITNVLEEAQKLKSHVSDCNKSLIKMAIEQLKLAQFEKLGIIDGVLLKIDVEIQQSQSELHHVSRFDYRDRILPLVKAYLKVRLVASIEREAKIKSDAARDALLYELVEESNKNIKERSDSANQLEKKTKNKKRTKQNRKMNKLKAKDDDELILAELAEELEATTYEFEQHNVDTTMADHSPAAHDEKSPNQVRLEEIEAQKKKLVETEKELEATEKLIEEMTTELEEKKNLHAQKLIELQNEDEENIKNALKNHAEKGKELDVEEKFIQDMVTELREKQECLFKQQKLLAIDEERIKSCLFWSHLKI